MNKEDLGLAVLKQIKEISEKRTVTRVTPPIFNSIYNLSKSDLITLSLWLKDIKDTLK